MALWAFVSSTKMKILKFIIQKNGGYLINYWLTDIGKYHRITSQDFLGFTILSENDGHFLLGNDNRASRFIFNLHFHIIVNLTNIYIRSCHFQWRIEPIIKCCSQFSDLEFILKRQVEMVGKWWNTFLTKWLHENIH